jgi:type I restriction enzyme M protein
MDTLSNRFPEKFPDLSEGFFDVILANPPFKGSLDYDDIHPSLLKKVKTKKTELLFVTLILKMLKTGGRSATIVPDGVLFGSSKAHLALRQLLVDHNQLEAVISLPSGVFKPYAGVSTAVIIFTKGGRTNNVFFYDVQGDGFSLDDKREQLT